MKGGSPFFLATSLALLVLLAGCQNPSQPSPTPPSTSFMALYDLAQTTNGNSYCSADLKKMLADDPGVQPLLATAEFQSFAGSWLDQSLVLRLGCGGAKPKKDAVLTPGDVTESQDGKHRTIRLNQFLSSDFSMCSLTILDTCGAGEKCVQSDSMLNLYDRGANPPEQVLYNLESRPTGQCVGLPPETFFCSTCVKPKDPECGDGICEPTETMKSCVDDCGVLVEKQNCPNGQGVTGPGAIPPLVPAAVSQSMTLDACSRYFCTSDQLAESLALRLDKVAGLYAQSSDWQSPDIQQLLSFKLNIIKTPVSGDFFMQWWAHRQLNGFFSLNPGLKKWGPYFDSVVPVSNLDDMLYSFEQTGEIPRMQLNGFVPNASTGHSLLTGPVEGLASGTYTAHLIVVFEKNSKLFFGSGGAPTAAVSMAFETDTHQDIVFTKPENVLFLDFIGDGWSFENADSFSPQYGFFRDTTWTPGDPLFPQSDSLQTVSNGGEPDPGFTFVSNNTAQPLISLKDNYFYNHTAMEPMYKSSKGSDSIPKYLASDLHTGISAPHMNSALMKDNDFYGTERRFYPLDIRTISYSGPGGSSIPIWKSPVILMLDAGANGPNNSNRARLADFYPGSIESVVLYSPYDYSGALLSGIDTKQSRIIENRILATDRDCPSNPQLENIQVDSMRFSVKTPAYVKDIPIRSTVYDTTLGSLSYDGTNTPLRDNCAQQPSSQSFIEHPTAVQSNGGKISLFANGRSMYGLVIQTGAADATLQLCSGANQASTVFDSTDNLLHIGYREPKIYTLSDLVAGVYRGDICVLAPTSASIALPDAEFAKASGHWFDKSVFVNETIPPGNLIFFSWNRENIDNRFKQIESQQAQAFASMKNICAPESETNGAPSRNEPVPPGDSIVPPDDNLVPPGNDAGPETTYLVKNGPPEEKLDILFLPTTVPNQTVFMDMMNQALNSPGETEINVCGNIHDRGLFQIEPYKSNREKMNVAYSTNFDYQKYCTQTDAPEGSWGFSYQISCDMERVRELYSSVKPDIIVFLMGGGGRTGGGGGAIYLDLFKRDADQTPKGPAASFAHEFSHSFAGLTDEYAYTFTTNLHCGHGDPNPELCDYVTTPDPCIHDTTGTCFQEMQQVYHIIPNIDTVGCPKWCQSYDLQKDHMVNYCSHYSSKASCIADPGDCLWFDSIHPWFNSHCVPRQSFTDIGTNCSSKCNVATTYDGLTFTPACSDGGMMYSTVGDFDPPSANHIGKIFDCCFPIQNSSQCQQFRDGFANLPSRLNPFYRWSYEKISTCFQH